jgi:tRNA nucleotidyltransferase/poly(A) polymerase
MKLLREYIRELLTEQPGGPRRMPLDIPIPEDLKAIHRQMKSAGMQLFLVGGAVRDALMNKVPKDYDVATDATPEAVIELLQQDPEFRIDLTGKAFGVVRVKTPAGEEYEIATFRKETYNTGDLEAFVRFLEHNDVDKNEIEKFKSMSMK